MMSQFFFRGRRKFPVLLAFLLLPGAIEAKNIGADPPKNCTCACSCSVPTSRPSNTSSGVSISEGNVMEQAPVSRTRSTNGSTVNVTATYNSYNADGSRAAVDTVMGYGWTHSYNVFLFTQFGAMFRYDGQGRIGKYGVF